MNFPLPFDFSLAPPQERILVAVSGGADSLALLLALHNAGREIVAGHVNHNLRVLRGDECDRDEEFVAARCAQLGVPFVAQRVQIPQRDGHATEAAAREARYRALAEMAREHNCARVATGHTANDVLETVLLNWLRAASVRGLAGIPPQRELAPELAPGVLLVRPLLAATREETRNACRAAGWDWREDSSNRERYYARNRIRHDVLPALARAGEVSTARLARQGARAAALLRDDLDYLDEAAREHLARLQRPTTERAGRSTLALDGAGFRALHPALQRRVLREAVAQLQGETRDLPAQQIEEVRQHVARDGRRKVWTWRRGVFVEWTGAMAGNRLRLWLVWKVRPA